MKKTLIALAAVAATSAAFAQSSVTIYGKVEAGLQKLSDSPAQMTNIHGSRLGFRGTEDLGGGLKANFGIEHRFSPDTGMDASFVAGTATTASTNTMWNGFSTVGLAGSFGEVRLGRYYTANFLGANNKADPFGGDGAGALRAVGMQTTYVRAANQIHYSGSFSGVNVAVSAGLKESAAKGPNAVAVSYANGPLDVGFGIDNGADDGKVTNLYAKYDLGVALLAFGMGMKETAAGAETDGWLLGATIPAGPGKVLVGYARAKNDTATLASKVGLGYYYPLSKRTALEFTYGNNNKATTNKSGFDFTLHHNF